LRIEFEGMHPEQIVEQRRKGIEVEEIIWEPIFAFTGDTQIEFLDVSPQVRSSKVLMMEVTYYDSKKSIASAREWGHIHLEELIPRLDSISAESIVLIHSSRRHSRREILSILDARIPALHRERIILF
jgi:ribonuclease Z